MKSYQILIIILVAVILFWIAPCFAIFILIFCRRHRPENAMKKPYFVPIRDKMEESIAFLEGLSPKEVTVTARDGIRLYARWFDQGKKKTVIMAHGFKASAYSNFCISGKVFWERGYNLLLIDQRMHGRSEGRHTTYGLEEQYDLLRWIDWAKEHTETEELFVYGVSMGCAQMAFASDKIGPERVKAMILDCGFTSVRDQLVKVAVQKHAPWKGIVPVLRLAVRLRWGHDVYVSVADSLKRTRIPAFFLHGEADQTVPVTDGQRNYEACASKKEICIVPGAEHTMAFVVGGKEVWDRLFAFLDQAAEHNKMEQKEGKS